MLQPPNSALPMTSATAPRAHCAPSLYPASACGGRWRADGGWRVQWTGRVGGSGCARLYKLPRSISSSPPAMDAQRYRVVREWLNSNPKG